MFWCVFSNCVANDLVHCCTHGLRWKYVRNKRFNVNKVQTTERMKWGSEVRWTDNLVKMGKWSDREQLVADKDGAREESEEVTTSSKIWFLLWVGKLTCWIKLKEDKRDNKWEVRWSVWLSICKLKSLSCYYVFMGSIGSNRKERINFINKDRIGFRKGR